MFVTQGTKNLPHEEGEGANVFAHRKGGHTFLQGGANISQMGVGKHFLFEV